MGGYYGSVLKLLGVVLLLTLIRNTNPRVKGRPGHCVSFFIWVNLLVILAMVYSILWILNPVTWD
jgi:hypothetical protein